MQKPFYIPSKHLSAYVDRYIVCKQQKELPLILPGTGLELLFHTHTPLSINNNQLPKAHIICPRESLSFTPSKQINYIAVRFKSGAFRHFCNLPHKYIINNYLAVEDIWPKESKQLLNSIENIEQIDLKIKAIEVFLLKQLKKNQVKETVNWDKTIYQLYKYFNTIQLHDLASNCNLSYRQFERNFKTNFGITPKKFQRISRLQKTSKQLLLSKSSNYLAIALDNGYYDQSHFIKEFKLFTNFKPTLYFNDNNFENHFFYSSIKS